MKLRSRVASELAFLVLLFGIHPADASGIESVNPPPASSPTSLPTNNAAKGTVMNEIRPIILERAAALKGFPGQRIPAATPDVLRQADQIAEGTVFFYGRTPVNVGLKDIDWSGSHIKHQEWPAQLNRFFHLAPLAAAYQATGNEKYAKAARAYIEDWIRGDPYETAKDLRSGDNTLNMSIRLGCSQFSAWGGTLRVFLKSPSFDDVFVQRILTSIAHQATWLSHHLTPTGNWRISELDALVFTALRFPSLPGAQDWLALGTDGMSAAMATQFLPDGVHIERTPGYHHWMAEVAGSYVLLAKIFPQADARIDPDLLVRALDYSAQSDLFGVNDSIAPLKDPDKLASVEKRREILGKLGLGIRPDAPPLDQVFPVAGQVFTRTAWKPGADYLAFDASTWGGGHGHLSRLSLAFRSGGRMLVADPGIFSYEMTDPMAEYGKSTRAHSTLNIDGLNQSGADAHLLRADFTDKTALIHARYEGGYWSGKYYWNFRDGRGQGVYGNHDRIVFWIKGEYLLVLDSMGTDKGHEIQNIWQLGPMDVWANDPAQELWWSKNKDTNLLLQMIHCKAGKVDMEVREGSRDPIAGWVGSHANDSVPAPRIEFRYRADRPEDVWSAVLLAPFKDQVPPKYQIGQCRESNGGALRYLEMVLPDGSVDHFAWSRQLVLPVDSGEPFATDGPFVWYRTDAAGRRLAGHALDASYLRFRGKVVLNGQTRKSQQLQGEREQGR